MLSIYKLKVQEDFEFCGYIKLRLWVSPLDHDDMDLEACMEKLTLLGTSYPDMPTSARRAVGNIRLSLRELDPERSTEELPYPESTAWTDCASGHLHLAYGNEIQKGRSDASDNIGV